MEPTPYTAIPYLYRDAANYKQHSYLIADGKITRQQIDAMQAVLWQDDSFLPTQLGLDHLGTQLDGFPDDDDHPWHEIDLDNIETGHGDPGVQGAHVGHINAFANQFVTEGSKGWHDTDLLIGQ